jgi:hypothetical protein
MTNKKLIKEYRDFIREAHIKIIEADLFMD